MEEPETKIMGQWRRLQRGPRPWDVSPNDWQHFPRNGAPGLVVAILLVGVLQIIPRDFGPMRSAGLALVELSFAQASVWGAPC